MIRLWPHLFVVFLLVQITFAREVQSETDPDPDLGRAIIELIQSRGFEYEVHYVTTRDGYILGIYRIINPFVDPSVRSTLRPVVLQHGFISSATTFLINSPDGFAVPCDPSDQLNGEANNDTRTNNLGFLLANQCYDVWLSNSRGNKYSRNHTYLDPDKDEVFWQFSFDEMIQYDAPDMIDYILGATGYESLSWIGHSQGTMIMFGLLSQQPAYSQKVKPFVALAPVCYVSNIMLPLRIASAIPGALWTLRHAGGELFEGSPILKITTQIACQRWEPKVCDNLIYPLKSYSTSLLNASRIDVFKDQLRLDSTSVWNLVHYGQNVNARSFSKFNFGSKENYRKYGGPRPPKYPLSQINSTQLAFFHSKGDALGDPNDVQRLIDELKVPLFRDYEIPIPTWDHEDFIFANDLYEVVHQVVLEVLRDSHLQAIRDADR